MPLGRNHPMKVDGLPIESCADEAHGNRQHPDHGQAQDRIQPGTCIPVWQHSRDQYEAQKQEDVKGLLLPFRLCELLDTFPDLMGLCSQEIVPRKKRQ